ncbi:MAG TPA: NTP transferase domain-containing protein, partial [Candidatus Eisenbacteria bacterium]
MIAGVLLAAGASRRMGRAKALVGPAGRTFIARGIRNLASACDRVVVVLGSDAARIRIAAAREVERLVRAGALRGTPGHDGGVGR